MLRGIYMPEIAEVETVRNTLKKIILNKRIKEIKAYYPKILLDDVSFVNQCLRKERFIDIKRRGKWLLFETEHYFLLSHLRMEGKYFIKKENDPIEKHEHVEIIFDDGTSLRYHDTRKFGRMKVVKKEELESFEGIHKQGIEPIDKNLTLEYLYKKLHNHSIPIKTLLLDQTIISGLGNIYANEVLFDAQISPFKVGSKVTKKECERIISSCYKIISKAIESGGTTIRSYTSSLGVTGRFQQYLKVHKKEKEPCEVCSSFIQKDFIGGRSTYYCPKCQKVNRTK